MRLIEEKSYRGINMVSEIQGKILAMISKSDGMRYSEAYPGEGIDDDLYNYHLQELVKKGSIEKKDKIYRLTNKGKHEITDFNAKGDELGRFHLVNILIVARNNKSEILIHKRNLHPHRGEISTASGNVLMGEKIVDAAKRRLKEETGLEAEFTHWGDFRAIRKTAEGKLFEDMIFCMCVAQDPTGELITKNDFGENWWESFDKIYEYLDQGTAIAQLEKKLIKKIQLGEENGGAMEEEVVILKEI